MALQANKLRLGVFFVLIMTLFIGAIFWLVGGFTKDPSTEYACYYPWSVSGLNVGSSVNYNGVPVGSVISIGIAPDGRLVKVVLQIVDDKFKVDETIVASLYVTGITGLRNVNLESLPDSIGRQYRQDQLSFESDLPVIPVRSGTVQSVTTGITRLFEIMESIDAKELNDQAILALTRINVILEDVEYDSIGFRISSTIDKIDLLLITYNNLGVELSSALGGMTGDVAPLLSDIHSFMDELTVLSSTLSYMADDLESTFDDTEVILHEISVMLPTLNRMLEGLFSSSSGEDVWR
ncbi:MAG: MCE family protein [Candidatus Fermentibacteraceae bacterium]|nr:MCE family protein [Candidatus Fermentibacteraceae bacterium]